MNEQRIVILEERDTEAGIAYLSDGSGAPAIILIVSWSTIEDAQEGMAQISQCGSWSVAGEDNTLMITGRGQLLLPTGEIASAVFWSSWEMDDPYVVSFFVARVRTQGYFLLLPAVNKMPGIQDPVPCYLG